MTDPKFTPGPWNAVRKMTRDEQYDIWAKDPILAVKSFGKLHEGLANIRLIAAAPEMYVALSTVRDYLLWNKDGLTKAEITKIVNVAIDTACRGQKQASKQDS